MIPWSRCMLAVLLGAAAAQAAPERPTRVCNPGFYTGEVFINAPAAARQRIMELVANPASDPDMVERLWRPSSARIYDWQYSEDDVVIQFTGAQDTSEVSLAIKADPRLRELGVTGAWPNSYDICGTPPPPTPMQVTEYHNAITDHYFLSSSAGENASIDSGAAGPGWTRTGEVFDVKRPQACTRIRPVFRFYTRGANSHFFTVGKEECGTIRNQDPGWIFEGEAFGAEMPFDGACVAGTKPVYRAYNGRWRQNDSNHRYMMRVDLYQQMIARGWIGEGIAMCVHN